METLFTVHVSPEKGVRLSRVTAHGEELLADPSLEARALGVKLWAELSHQAPSGHVSMTPPLAEIQALSKSLQEYQKHLELPGTLLARILKLLAQMSEDLHTMNQRLLERVPTAEDLQAWLQQATATASTTADPSERIQ